MLLLFIVFVSFLLIGCYLFCIAPNKYREGMEPFSEYMIAHRGLFDNNGNAPENSIPAFFLAVEKKYGIELDVQLTTDGKMVVFHDESLKRMCGIDKELYTCSYAEIQKLCLLRSKESIPLFEDVLKIIDGKVPLIVEIKSSGNFKRTTEKTAEILSRYQGVYCIESFHPLVVKWYRQHHPKVFRGQLSTNFFIDTPNRRWMEKVILTNLLANVISRPDFIAYNHQFMKQPSYCICRKLYQSFHVAWTIKSEEERDKAGEVFQAFIFDSFIPKKRK